MKRGMGECWESNFVEVGGEKIIFFRRFFCLINDVAFIFVICDT